MKIAIFTQPLHSNFGGSIQNFALQIFLKKLGHVPVTIRLIPTINKSPIFRFCRIFEPKISFPRRLRRIAMFAFCTLAFPFGNLTDKVLKTRGERADFKDFHDKFIDFCWMKNPPRERDFRDFSAFIVGSDQVWRPAYNAILKTMFLQFVERSQDKKRIAYAASFGLDDAREFDAGTLKICRKLLQKFDAISVREASGIAICQRDFGVPATHLLDPTMLLNPDDYAQIAGTEKLAGTPFLATYILDDSPEKSTLAGTLAEHFRVPAEALNSRSPAGWIRGFRDAQFVVTDSFHGTVFSIIFNKPFIAIGNAGRGLARFTSLLELFNLRERLILLENLPSRERVLQLAGTPIDWARVNAIRSREISRSREFLESALRGNDDF